MNVKPQPSTLRKSPLSTRKTQPVELGRQEDKKSKDVTGTRLGQSTVRKPGLKSKQKSVKEKVKLDGDKDDKKEETPIQKLTKSGLKIIDWSGQGMTTVPLHSITAKDIGHLILSSNNLRSVPVEIAYIKCLEKLDVSRNSIRCTSSTDFSGLPEEMALLVNLTELYISECNLPFVPPAIFKMTNLRNLDISRNKINILLPDIGQLVNLTRLNLQQTNIPSLPAEIAYCQELEEIYLWGNSIENLPETLSEIPNLRVLAINYKSFCSVVDPYMVNLLKKGQIKSEHIPLVVFELAALEVLDLEETKLNNIPDMYNQMLKELYLCRNFLQTIPESIYNLSQLRVLDLSNNLLCILPEDIGQLDGLKILQLANNSFEEIPSAIGNLSQLEEFNIAHNKICSLPPEIKKMTLLKVLIVAHNKIQKLPDEICELTQLHTLDLTDNEIDSLPTAIYHLTNLTTAHTFHKLQKSGLWLFKNPLQLPPPQVWRSDMPDKTFEYLKNLVTFKTENLRRQKILVFGESQCGKTSLVQALTLKKSKLTNGTKDKTRLLQQILWKTDNNVEFILYDFGGDNAYRMLYRMFLDSKALIIIVFNVATFNENIFYSSIGQWLDMLDASSPGAVVKLVGTQVDLLSADINKEVINMALDNDNIAQNSTSTISENDESKKLKEESHLTADTGKKELHEVPSMTNIYDQVYKYQNLKEIKIKEELESLQSEMIKLQQSLQLTEADDAHFKMMQMRENQLKLILQNPLKIVPEVSLVSAASSLKGIRELTGLLEYLAIDKEIFPHAYEDIPDHWNELLSLLKQKAGYFVYWTDVETVGEMFSVKDEELLRCIKHFANIGDVLWLDEDPMLKHIVFHKPKMLVNIITSLYRHDIADFLNYDNKLFFCKGRLSNQQFEQCACSFINTGSISRPLVKCLLFSLNFKNKDISKLLDTLSLLEVCFSVPEPNVYPEHFHIYPLIVLPWFNRNSDTEFLEALWPSIKPNEIKEMSVVYSFPFFCPPEIFHSLSVKIQYFAEERFDWKDSIYADCGLNKLLIHHSAREAKIFLTVRGSESTDMQIFMEEIVSLLNNHLLKYPSLYWKLTIPPNDEQFNTFNNNLH